MNVPGMNAPESITTSTKPESIFEGILRKFENDVNLAVQLSTRGRILVEKLIGTEPEPDTEAKTPIDSTAFADKLAQYAEELRIRLNETADWLTKLEESF